MRSWKLVLLLLVLGSSLLSTAAAAQTGSGSDPAQELERTDRILDRAREQVGVSPSARADKLLNVAIEMQIRAKRTYDSRNRTTWQPALRMTQQAREFARRAIETAEIEVKAHESVRDLIESTRDMTQDATALVQERGDPEAQRLLDGGLWLLQRAQEAYRESAYRKAIRLAATARDLVQRATQRARGGAPAGGASVETALDRAQALIEELRVNLEGSGDQKAMRLRDEALRLQDRAMRMQRERKPALALRLTTQARHAALEAILALSSRPDEEEVERALSVVEQLIQDSAPGILASRSSGALDLLESARQRLADAREQFAKGNAPQALAMARIAEGLLHRAADSAEDH
jgi:hypothetical protein